MIAGRVATFDQARGLGEVADERGAVHSFHCIEIADGTRDIEVGADVSFEIRRKLGRLEAVAIRPRR